MRKSIIFLFLLVFLFNNSYSQWITLQSPTTSDLNTVNFINTSTGYVAGVTGLIFKTTNGGTNWISLSSGITASINSIYFLNSNTGIACGNSGNIIISTNSGSSWNPVTSGISNNLNSISFQNNYGICAGSSGTLLYSTNAGFNWNVGVTGFLTTYYGAFVVSQSTAFACGVNTIFQPFVAKTTNGGVNWNYTAFYLNSNEGNLRDIYFISATEGFAVSHVFNGQGGVSYTANGGTNWSTQLFGNFLYGLDFVGTNIGYAVGAQGYIIKTTNQGTDWINQTSGVTNDLKSVDFLDPSNGYVVGNGGRILKTTNGGLVSVNNNISSIPNNFYLEQNYPNPFNPHTVINYTIGAGKLQIRDYIKIKVYDVQGKELKTLVNQRQDAGEYNVKFDGTDLASGIYIYRLEVDGEVMDSKSMILLR